MSTDNRQKLIENFAELALKQTAGDAPQAAAQLLDLGRAQIEAAHLVANKVLDEAKLIPSLAREMEIVDIAAASMLAAFDHVHSRVHPAAEVQNDARPS